MYYILHMQHPAAITTSLVRMRSKQVDLITTMKSYRNVAVYLQPVPVLNKVSQKLVLA